MLKIDRVEIHGFKSFCDRTEVKLPEGITAVVGPNGCGKSNIGDALHWVLGEQSARTLRGGKMEDVIFAGTEARGPHGMAEVSLHLQSSNGDLPSGEPSAIVTRRLFRSGDCEYLINGRKVRLRDVQEMLHSAHVGTTTYAVIEQGKIDAILSAKPRDRRQLIEDAAGIIGYKQKRHLAELKLQATEANLLRIHDVILEVRRQINSLKRQAARARRYSRVRDELRTLDARIIAARARALHADAERVRRDLEEAQAREAEAAAGLARVEAQLEAARLARRDLESRIAAVRESVHSRAREIDREEATIRAEAERAEESRQEETRLVAEDADMTARLERVRGERAGREQALAAIDSELDALERSLEALAAEETAVRRRGAALDQEIESQRVREVGDASRLAEVSNTIVHLRREIERSTMRHAAAIEENRGAEQEAASLAARAQEVLAQKEISEAVRQSARGSSAGAERTSLEMDEMVRALGESIGRRRETLARLDERVLSLESVEGRLAGVGSGARWLLTRNDDGVVRGIVADFLRVGPESEAAVEAYLGPLLGAVVVPSCASAVNLVADLEHARAGRCLFVPEEDLAAFAAPEPLVPELSAEPAVLGSLADRAVTTNGIQGILARRLGRAVLASDLPSAIDLARRYPGRDYITPAGDVVGEDGTIEGGRGEGSEDGILARRRLLEATRAEREEAAASLGVEEQRRREAERRQHDAEHEMVAAQRSLQEAERDVALAEERASGLAAERERSLRRAAILAEETVSHEQERAEIQARISSTESERAALEGELTGFAAAVQTRREDRDRFLSAASSLAERVAEMRQGRAAVRERRGHTAAEIARIEGEIGALAGGLEQGQRRRAEAEQRAQAADRATEEARQQLAHMLAAHAAASAELVDSEQRMRAADAQMMALEESAREGRARTDEIRERRRTAEVAAASAESELRHLDESSRTSLDEGLASILARVEAEPDADVPSLEAETASLRSRLEAMGPVNLLAIEEFREFEERHEFFVKQETDLSGSLESLKETIRRINRTSRERFLEAFEKIRVNFNETFRLLFGGGRADIKLMEDEDPLECGLEINVQPPGKKLQSLMLLSGGEKAMSAIALLFAIFRFQPSPFCLLDEVDAALDESNVRRFTHMLKEFSGGTQFIVITHNKRSMEAADTIYGVTMEEPGISRVVSMSLQ